MISNFPLSLPCTVSFHRRPAEPCAPRRCRHSLPTLACGGRWWWYRPLGLVPSRWRAPCATAKRPVISLVSEDLGDACDDADRPDLFQRFELFADLGERCRIRLVWLAEATVSVRAEPKQMDVPGIFGIWSGTQISRNIWRFEDIWYRRSESSEAGFEVTLLSSSCLL